MENLWLTVRSAGRVYARYRLEEGQTFLEAVHLPERECPFDAGTLDNAIWPDGEALHAILLGAVSHSPGTRVAVRLLGALAGEGGRPDWFVCVPEADPTTQGWHSPNDLPHDLTSALLQILENEEMVALRWLAPEQAEEMVREARRNYRLLQKNTPRSSAPAWKPADRYGGVTDFTEAEHYTAAEYTFFQLPYRFQDYLGQHLSDDERGLYALWRPSMTSRLQKRFFKRTRLNEGVLFLTTQRLIYLVELVPPDRSGVRYGFRAVSGALERLRAYKILRPAEHSVVLQTEWEARGGVQSLQWEFPLSGLSALRELLSLLEPCLPQNATRALRRATWPSPPDPLPPLTDPAANDPAPLRELDARFRRWLDDGFADEPVYAWALWPAWEKEDGVAEALIVTQKRVLIAADPAAKRPFRLDVPLTDIAVLDFQASILGSAITLHIPRGGEVEEVRLSFPYPAVAAFRSAYESLRRGVALAAWGA